MSYFLVQRTSLVLLRTTTNSSPHFCGVVVNPRVFLTNGENLKLNFNLKVRKYWRVLTISCSMLRWSSTS